MTEGIIVFEGGRKEEIPQLLMSIGLDYRTPIIYLSIRYIQQKSTKKENTVACR